jgi:peptidoglycan/LPS O-acetylase OafA/YrhL
VYLFFVLSAFLLTRQFFTAELAPGRTVAWLSEYFYRRCARILPLYYLAVLVHFSVQFIVPGKSCVIHDARAVLRSLLMNYGYGHFWTIPVEFIFYFILPAVAIVGVASRSKFVALGVYACFIALAAVVFGGGEPVGGVAQFAYTFVAGSLLALLYSYFKHPVSGLARWVIAVVALTAVAAFGATLPVLEGRGATYAAVENLQPWWTLCACGLIAGCLWGPGWFGRLFEARALLFLGRISFSVYVWHMLVYAIAANVGRTWSSEARHLAALAAAIMVGWVSFRLVEMRVYRSPRARELWRRTVDLWLLGDTARADQ